MVSIDFLTEMKMDYPNSTPQLFHEVVSVFYLLFSISAWWGRMDFSIKDGAGNQLFDVKESKFSV